MALAPRRDLVGVPSREIMAWSRARWSAASMPVMALGDFGVGVGDGFEHAFAEISGFVAIAEFECFVFAGGGAGRNGGTADFAGGQSDFSFDRGIAAGVDDSGGRGLG